MTGPVKLCLYRNQTLYAREEPNDNSVSETSGMSQMWPSLQYLWIHSSMCSNKLVVSKLTCPWMEPCGLNPLSFTFFPSHKSYHSFVCSWYLQQLYYLHGEKNLSRLCQMKHWWSEVHIHGSEWPTHELPQNTDWWKCSRYGFVKKSQGRRGSEGKNKGILVVIEFYRALSHLWIQLQLKCGNRCCRTMVRERIKTKKYTA